MNQIFHTKNGLTWETNPARSNVPGTHVESPAHADDLVECFSGAEACRFMGASQHFKHRISHKTLPYRGQRISPVMGCDALGCDEEHYLAVPLTARSSGSAGASKERVAERHLLGGQAFLVLLVHSLHAVVRM